MASFRALVVDDSQGMRKSILHALQRMGDVVCIEAQNGAEALKRLAAGQFDLIVTDINMPMLDGLKLIHHVRADERHAKVPILVVSTESAEKDRARAMQLGASGYLVKPVQAAEVVSAAQQLLGL